MDGQTRDGIACVLEYSRDLFEHETIRRMARHYEKLLKEVVRDAEQTIKEIELLSGAEREQILIEVESDGASVSERSGRSANCSRRRWSVRRGGGRRLREAHRHIRD